MSIEFRVYRTKSAKIFPLLITELGCTRVLLRYVFRGFMNDKHKIQGKENIEARIRISVSLCPSVFRITLIKWT
jgi:hypothetical protein